MRSFLSVQILALLSVGGGRPQRKTEAQPECVCQLQGKAPVPAQAYHVQNVMPFGKKSVSLS